MAYLEKTAGTVYNKLNYVKGAVILITDEELYGKYLDGDESAVDWLVSRYGDKLTCYINGYIADFHEAEDLMIESFARLFAKERKISGDGAFRAYLYRTARNLALRQLSKGRMPFICFDDIVFEPHDEVFADTGVIRSERERQLHDALGRLKEEYREALYLVYFENMSYRDAGRIMNKSEQQVTKLVHRGKRGLKALLEEDGFIYAD